jgi:hypothetical protein
MAREAGNLTAICESIVLKMWEPRRLTTLWAFTTCYKDRFTFTLEALSRLSFNLYENILYFQNYRGSQKRSTGEFSQISLLSSDSAR